VGKHPTPETIERLRQVHPTPETIEKIRQARLGKHHAPETIEKIRQAHVGKHRTPETIAKMRQVHPTPETIEKIRHARLGMHLPPETIEKIRQAGLGKHHTPETKEKLREKSKRRFQDPEFLRKWHKGNNSKTRPEAHYEVIVDSIYPNMIKYNGRGQQGISIGGLIPDFVCIDDKNHVFQVIEILGSYWHEEEDVKDRQERYAKCGYPSLFIWDYELKNEKEVVRKTIEFMGKEPNLHFEAREKREGV
jgi:very-short-patch-repair endonuclease